MVATFMTEPNVRLPFPLADTHHYLDTRSVLRLGGDGRRVVRVAIRPSLAPMVAAVRELSCQGVGLRCDRPLEPDTCLAVLWNFGPPSRWRTARARVVRVGPCRRGGWLMRCAF